MPPEGAYSPKIKKVIDRSYSIAINSALNRLTSLTQYFVFFPDLTTLCTIKYSLSF